MKISRSTFFGFAAVVAITCAHPSWGGTPTTATQDLLDEYDGLRAMFDGERIIALYGVPFAINADSRTSTVAFVGNFLNNNEDILGVIGLALTDPLRVIDIRDGVTGQPSAMREHFEGKMLREVNWRARLGAGM